MKAGNRDLSHRPKTIAEDDVLKRNTDCVYFLASPLTCKKGSECEYRHSEDARMNPRDCWFWLNGNCLNAKCSFRHPPLDGLLGTTASSPKKVSLPPTPTASSSTQFSATHTPAYSSGKQATPCFYFQKGLCLKGDRCPFMHGPQPIDSLVPQPLPPKVSVSFSELHTDKKAFGGLEKCTQQKKILQENIIKPVAAKQPTKAESAILSKNRIVVGETMPRPISFDDDLPRYKPTNFPPVIGGNSASRTDRGRQAQPSDDWSFRNGMEPGEFLRELSPGFDVLTVGAHRDSDYYQNEDEFRRMTAWERHLDDTPSKFDNGRLADYTKRETFKDQYPREQRRVSSERILERSSEREKRGFTRAESPSQVNESDLRYRLSKQRRIDGSRTAVSPDRRGDFDRRDDRSRQVVDHRYQGRLHKDPPHLLPHEGSISNRLQGRISLLGKPSPDSDHNDSHMERGRNRGRLSPVRPLTSSHQGRLQDRIKPRVQEDFTTEGGNFRGASIRRDDVDNNSLNFSGPKSLAELKSAKFSGYGEVRKNTKIGKIEGHQESEGGFPSFEGPKSLNVILKRKREEKTADSVDALVTEKHSDVPSSNKEVNHEDVEDEGLNSAEGDEVITHEGRSSAQKESEFETEDAIMDRVEDQEPESFDQRDGEFDYEQVDGGDLKTEEDENADLEDEYLDDEEDGDDFAKRIGVMFS